jgi:hypothetical protein
MDWQYKWFDKKQAGGRKQPLLDCNLRMFSLEIGYFVKAQCTWPSVLATFTTHPLSLENLYSKFLGFTTPKQTLFTTPHDSEMMCH